MNVFGLSVFTLHRSDFAQSLTWICQANKQVGIYITYAALQLCRSSSTNRICAKSDPVGVRRFRLSKKPTALP